ncbi:hypothetical protein ABT383_23960 [Streptomyces humidus]
MVDYILPLDCGELSCGQPLAVVDAVEDALLVGRVGAGVVPG